ncbi:MAG: hypothetical protein HQ525_09835 [Anaerolineae bacterium]|nr:hypothetical protein [Anaerolineae bacterium]
MNNSLILAIIIGFLIIGIAVFAINKTKGQKTEPNYRVLFILGIVWLPIGIATDNPGLLGLGAVFLIAGLANRSKWKEEPKWSELSSERRKIMMLVVGGLSVLLLAVIIAYIIANNN